MVEYKEELKKILSRNNLDNLKDHLELTAQHLNEKDFALFLIDSIYLKSVIELIIDSHWMQSKNSTTEIQFPRFVKKFLSAELTSHLFLHAFFSGSSIEEMSRAVKTLAASENILLDIIKTKSAEFKKIFLQFALHRMSEFYELEYQLGLAKDGKDSEAQLSLYRAFDLLDQIFELEYLLNEVPLINQKERLYEGAGVGVQSSYATTLLALRYLNLPKGSKFIDLGSGYGRIGLVLGLMRPDIQFTGYEFVKERVDIANKSSVHFHLDQHVHFLTQDLSDLNFKIPDADTYYIFDSFTDASYATIISQLEKITIHKKITIVTKGNARLWFKSKYWSAPQELCGGNICFFRSSVRPR